jgi:hypothetical protein
MLPALRLISLTDIWIYYWQLARVLLNSENNCRSRKISTGDLHDESRFSLLIDAIFALMNGPRYADIA